MWMMISESNNYCIDEMMMLILTLMMDQIYKAKKKHEESIRKAKAEKQFERAPPKHSFAEMKHSLGKMLIATELTKRRPRRERMKMGKIKGQKPRKKKKPFGKLSRSVCVGILCNIVMGNI